MGWSVWAADLWGSIWAGSSETQKPSWAAGPEASAENGPDGRFLGCGQRRMKQGLRTWSLRPPVSLRCSSGSSSDWPGGSPEEPLETLCCFPWPRAVTGPCPGLSRPRPHLPHCRLQIPPARPVSCPAQRPLPGPCPSPRVRLGLEGRRKRLGHTGARRGVLNSRVIIHCGRVSRPQSPFLV